MVNPKNQKLTEPDPDCVRDLIPPGALSQGLRKLGENWNQDCYVRIVILHGKSWLTPLGIFKLSPTVGQVYRVPVNPSSSCGRRGPSAKRPAYTEVFIAIHFVRDEPRSSIFDDLEPVRNKVLDEA